MKPYQITEDMFVQAMSYAQKRSRTIIISVCIIVPLAIYMLKGFPREMMASVLIVYIILAFYFLVLAPMINRMNYQRAYRKNSLLHKTQYYEISETEVHFKSENGESRYQLADVQRLVIFPELVMIYPTTSLFHLIPRSTLTEDELDILSRHIKV